MRPGTTEWARKTPVAVVKRDGARVAFDQSKIDTAIARAGAASGEFRAHDAVRIGRQVARALAARGEAASTRPRSAMLIATPTSTSTTSTCSPATAQAGRCGSCCTRA